MGRVPGQAGQQWRACLLGGVCLVLGLLAGSLWPRDAAGPVFDSRPPAPAAAAPPTSFADIVANARPGIVSVRAFRPVPVASDPGEGWGLLERAEAAATPGEESGVRYGSGFVVHADGLVVTSRHVVAAADAIEVVVTGHGTRDAVVVGEDVAADLALLRILDPPRGLAALPIGDSEALRAGDWIVAVGTPYGLAQTVTAGVVSFVGRHLPHNDLAVTSDFVQISAPVNPGSSGGPVLGLDGRVVGVTTQAAVEAQGISFAVPSRTLKWVLEAIRRTEDGRVRRGYLGIEFATNTAVDAGGAPCGGARIVRVLRGAPAQAAGIRAGDVVLEVDGEPITDARTLHERIVNGAPGARLAMQVLRGEGRRDSIDAVLGEMRPFTTPMTWN